MEIRQSAEDYLESILVLSKKGGGVRSIDIATRLGVSKPSVSHAMKLLREDGYIAMDRYGTVTLLEKGADVEMTVSGDEICKACPNLKHGVCLSADLVEHYDRKVLEYCGLKERENLSFRDFVDNVQKNIIETGKRVEICGGCQWNEICSRKESRWK